MNGELVQDGRVAVLKTPLGANKLALTRFRGEEALSELFKFRIDALSKDPDIDFDKALGRVCSVAVTTYAEPKRYFAGVLVEAETLGMVDDLHAYSLTLRPALWLLSRTANCRIWHDKTALEIIKEVLSQRGVDHKVQTTRTCRKREYCVQYRETDLDYVSRLMEDEGIYYFHEFGDNKHTMVLADSPSSHKPIPGHATLRYSTVSAGEQLREEALYELFAKRRFRTGKFELRDYNFKTPGNKLIGPARAPSSYEKSDLENYDYPGRYDIESEGKAYAEIKRDAEQALDKRRHVAGEAPSLFPGGLVTLKNHPKQAENRCYLVVRATHRFSTQMYRSARMQRSREAAARLGDDGEEERYSGAYEFQPSDRAFRAPIVTPKPVVHGPQTARVVQRPNGAGEEIDVDDDGHGRIRVRFHWDRDDKRSCWVRVAQTWAGAKWGGQFIPRVDMEVVVEFLEGDPDRPLIVGCVYNNDNKYPWSLPANKTQSGIKSDSSKGHNGYNQIRFEDKKTSEQIEVHAEKDLDSTILHAETRKIGERFDKGPGSPSRETTLVMGDDKLMVQMGHRDTTISMDDKLKVLMNQDKTIGMKRTAMVGLSDSETVGLSQSVTVGVSQSTTVGASLTTTVGAAVTISAGGVITLSGGGSTIILSPAGIVLTGATISCVGATMIPVLTAAGTINLHP